jgi:hypothetical protein
MKYICVVMESMRGLGKRARSPRSVYCVPVPMIDICVPMIVSQRMCVCDFLISMYRAAIAYLREPSPRLATLAV